MPNQRKYKERVCYSFNTDRDLLNRTQQAAKKRGMTASEYITNLMREDLQKNEVGQPNPLNLSYTARDIYDISKKGLTISLDKFMDVTELKAAIEVIPKQSQSFAFANTKKANQQIELVMYGKITV